MEQIPESRERYEGVGGSIPDILAIIDSAKARGGTEALERYVAKALPQAEELEVEEAASVAAEIIESIPVFLARARQAGHERGLTSVVKPLLDHAERYFLQPMDVIPEMTQGLPGLLDDAYLVIRIIEHLDKGPEEYLDWDLDYPRRFLSRLMGPAVTDRLDAIADDAMDEVSTHLRELWAKMAHKA